MNGDRTGLVEGVDLGTGAARALAMALVVIAMVMLGCHGRSLSAPPAAPDPLDRDHYRMGETDLLRVTVWKNEDLSVDVPIRPDGKISVPLLDDIQAAGLTPTELKEILTREFGEYITAPNVTVVVLQMNSRSISVLGGVNRPGHYPIERNLRVLEAIAGAGGFSAFAQKNDIRVVRRAGMGGEQEYKFNYGAYIKGRAPGTNIELVSGDTIIVPD